MVPLFFMSEIPLRMGSWTRMRNAAMFDGTASTPLTSFDDARWKIMCALSSISLTISCEG